MTRPVVIDLSRLCWRARFVTPTGIDRVELAYARHFMRQTRREVRFVVRTGALGAREIGKAALTTFLDNLERTWQRPDRPHLLHAITRLLARSSRARDPGQAITIIPSHQNWHRAAWLEQRRGRHGRLVLFLHDLIPLQYPEYARDGGAERHRQRIANALDVADGFIVNSAATAGVLDTVARDIGRPARSVTIAPLGTDMTAADPACALPQQPYFLTVGTIEPRKNHMLLLLLWRSMAEGGIADLPRLVVAGRRGWENEQVVDMLDRCPALRGLVEERPNLGDAERASLLAGAQALLMPSFAEGFGMPVNEALAAGTPVIAGTLPVYAETAGDIPDYCDPLDGRAWQEAVLSYARKDSPARQAQLQRLQGWQAPGWDEHFERVEHLLAGLD